MKRYLLIFSLAVSAIGMAACGAPANMNNANPGSNSNVTRSDSNGPVAAHNVPGGTTDSTHPAGNPGPPPTGDPIDATKVDADIEKAEKAHAAKPDDAKTTKALANAYFARAEALKDARQYRAALGDYRKTVRFDPTNKPAQDMLDQIVTIMQSMGREVPAEGQEPPAARK